VETWLSLVEHSLGARGGGSSSLAVPTFLIVHSPEDHVEGLGVGRAQSCDNPLECQKVSRTPSWISLFASAEVNPRGWLGDKLAVPFTLKGGAKVAPTILLTVA